MKSIRDSLNPDGPTLRQFAVGWTVFFFGTGIFQYARHGRTGLGLGLGAAAVIGLGLWWQAPRVFRWIFQALMLIAFPIGWLSSQLALALMFFAVLTPLALLFRLVKRDRLGRVKPAAGSSYWIPKKMAVDVRSYFKPY